MGGKKRIASLSRKKCKNKMHHQIFPNYPIFWGEFSISGNLFGKKKFTLFDYGKRILKLLFF